MPKTRLNVRALTRVERIRFILAYAFRRRPSLWMFLIVVVIGMIFLTWTGSWPVLKDEFRQYLHTDPIDKMIQGVTLLVVISMWILELIGAWRDSLPKYLSVEFRLRGIPSIRCRYAFLVGEADMRQMAQSLGQMVNGGRLPLAPTFESVETAEMIDRNGCLNEGRPFLHYQTLFQLTRNVDKIQPDSIQDGSDQKKHLHLAGKYIEWNWPFEPVNENCLKPLEDTRHDSNRSQHPVQ